MAGDEGFGAVEVVAIAGAEFALEDPLGDFFVVFELAHGDAAHG